MKTWVLMTIKMMAKINWVMLMMSQKFGGLGAA